jgi:hypothetical protein
VTVVYFDNRIRHLTTIIDSIMKDVNNEKEPFSAGGSVSGYMYCSGMLLGIILDWQTILPASMCDWVLR